LFQSNKSRYAPINKDAAKNPVCLTLLRKDAIEKILLDYNNFSSDDAVRVAEEAFHEWSRARHVAMPNHFASSVVACLKDIASIRSGEGRPVLIGAITDGNSDPRKVEAIKEYFDFVVNAESVGVGKPAKRLYLHSVREVINHPTLSDLIPESTDSFSDEQLEKWIGPFWVHVGDDFAKDVVPAKSLNMRTVWARELVMNKTEVPKVSEKMSNEKLDNVEDFVKKVSEMKVIKMEIGTDDYLVSGLQREFADATIDEFSELAGILKQWHEEAQKEKSTPLIPSSAPNNDILITEGDLKPKEAAKEQLYKFCMFCGQKLPTAAQFCSSCGKKQEL